MSEDKNDRVADAPEGPEPTSSKPKLKDYAGPWMEARILDLKPGTMSDYRSQLKNHILPRWGESRLDEIRTLDIRAWITEMRQAKQIGNRTIHNIYGLLRNIMSEAVADEIIAVNPCCLKARHLPPNDNEDPTWGERHVFSREELLRIIDHPKIPIRSRCLYTLLFATGVRIGEALALTWADVHLDEDVPWLSVAKSYSSKTNTVGSTKTGVAKKIPIHPRLEDHLYRWLGEYHLTIGVEPEGENLLFPAPRGSARKHMRSSVVYHDFNRELVRMGMPRRRVHDCRRTFVTLAANTEDVDGETIKRVTHPSPSDVAGSYREVPVKVLAREVNKLDLGQGETDG